MAQKMQISDFLVKKNVSLLQLFVDPCEKSYILDGVSFEQHEEFQINLSLCVQLSKHNTKIYFFSWSFLNYST